MSVDRVFLDGVLLKAQAERNGGGLCFTELPVNTSHRLITYYAEHWLFVDTLFQGIRARIIPIPQVSVIPANMSPAPTKADRPIRDG